MSTSLRLGESSPAVAILGFPSCAAGQIADAEHVRGQVVLDPTTPMPTAISRCLPGAATGATGAAALLEGHRPRRTDPRNHSARREADIDRRGLRIGTRAHGRRSSARRGTATLAPRTTMSSSTAPQFICAPAGRGRAATPGPGVRSRVPRRYAKRRSQGRRTRRWRHTIIVPAVFFSVLTVAARGRLLPRESRVSQSHRNPGSRFKTMDADSKLPDGDVCQGGWIILENCGSR